MRKTITCHNCHGTGLQDYDGTGIPPPNPVPCEVCQGEGTVPTNPMLDLFDKIKTIDDIMNKCNDIKEKVDEIMDKLNE